MTPRPTPVATVAEATAVVAAPVVVPMRTMPLVGQYSEAYPLLYLSL